MGITTFHALASLTELLSFERPLYYNLQLQRSIQFSKSIKGSCKLVRRWSSVQAKNDSVEVNRINKEQFLTDCGPDQQCVIGGIVALGKFDALHVGHRELAIQASKAGVPFLLSFIGMADVLGWEKRLPLVADCDRKRVLSSWAPLCAGMIPHEYHVQFSLVRHLSPRQFVERLSNELGVKGVVAGANYRFGYKASGDTSDLVHLCEEYGLKAFIVDPVMDMTIDSRATQSTAEAGKKEKGQVSSTQVRKALAAGNVKRANKLLGRKHRLLISTKESSFTEKGLVAYNSSLLNQPPGEGEYACDVLMESLHSVNSDNYSAESIIGSATLKISSNYLELYLRDGSFAGILDDDCYIGLDFLG